MAPGNKRSGQRRNKELAERRARLAAEAKSKQDALAEAEMAAHTAAQAVPAPSEQHRATPSSSTSRGSTIPPPSLDDTKEPRPSEDASTGGASDAQEGPPLSIRCKRSPAAPGTCSKLSL